MRQDRQIAPAALDVASYMVGTSHVRTTRSMKGLVHVGSNDPEALDERFLGAVNLHASEVYGSGVAYRAEGNRIVRDGSVASG